MRSVEKVTIVGINSSDRSHDPGMYVMYKPGNPKDDRNYKFVGLASANHLEQNTAGRLKAYYHIGVTALSEMVVCDVTTDIFTHSDLQPVQAEDIPVQVINAAIIHGANELPFEQGFRLLRGLGITLPEEPDILPPDALNPATISEEAIIKRDHWRAIGEKTLVNLGLMR